MLEMWDVGTADANVHFVSAKYDLSDLEHALRCEDGDTGSPSSNRDFVLQTRHSACILS